MFAVIALMNVGTASAATVTLPSGIIAYVPVNIITTSTISGSFQQMVSFSPSQYSTYINTNMQNVEFFYPNGQIIPSWLESYTSSNAVYWLNLNGVSANGNIIYMGFASTVTNLFDKATGVGEAPNLSSNYGLYDTGLKVFSYYQAFGGSMSSLPSGWSNTMAEDSTQGNTLITFNTDNTVVVSTGTGGGEGIYENPVSSMSPGNIIEWYGNMYNNQSAGSIAGLLSQGTANPTYCASPGLGYPMPLYEFNCNSMLYTFESGASTSGGTPTLSLRYGSTSVSTSYTEQDVNKVYSIAIPSSGASYNGMINYDSVGYMNGITSPTAAVAFAFSPGTNPANNENSLPQSVYWLRTRVYPPNGQMPSVSFGPVLPLSATLSISPSTPYVGQNVGYTVTPSGGISPYTYNNLVYNAISGALISNSLTSSTSSQPNTYRIMAPGNYLAQVEVTDSNSPNDIAYTANVPFNAIPYNGVVITSNTMQIDLGQPVSLTVNDIMSLSNGKDQFSVLTIRGSNGNTISSGSEVEESSMPLGFADANTPTSTGSVTYTVSGIMVYPLEYPIVSNSVVITVNNDPTVSASNSSSSVTTGGTETLTATVNGGTSPYTYQWYTISGATNTAITGATSFTYSPSTSATGTFTYGVNVIDAVGEEAYSNPVSFSVTSPTSSGPTGGGGGGGNTGGVIQTTTVVTTITPLKPANTTNKTNTNTNVPSNTVKPTTTTTVTTVAPATTVLPANTLNVTTPALPTASGIPSWLLWLALLIILLIIIGLLWWFLVAGKKRKNKKN